MNEQVKEYLPLDILKISTDIQSELIRNLNTQSDLTTMMTRIVDKTHNLLNASACTVFKIEECLKLTKISLQGLKYEGISDDMLESLKTLLDKNKYDPKDIFLKTIEDNIKKRLSIRDKDIFLKHIDKEHRAVQLAGTGYQTPFNGQHDVRVVPPSQVQENPKKILKLGLTGWILSTGKPFLARTPEEVQNHPHFGRRKQIPGHEIIRLQSFLGVPLRGLHGEVIGLIKAERRLPILGESPIESFSVEDQLALETIGRVASRCITYLEMAKEGQEIEAITGWARDVIAEATATEGELDSFLDVVVKVTAAAMRSHSCGIFLKDKNTLTQRAGIGSQALRSVIRAYPLPDPEEIQKCKKIPRCMPPNCPHYKPSFKLTSQCHKNLKDSERISPVILEKLEFLKDQEFTKDDLLTKIKELIGREEAGRYGEIILKYAKKGIGLTAWIAATGKSFYARNYAELSAHCHHRGGFDTWNFPKKEQTICGAFLGVPLQVGGEFIGVIKVENISKKEDSDPQDFPKPAQQCFEILAQDIALAIMRLQNQIPARYRVIRNAQRTILEILRGGLEVEKLAKKVVTETRTLFAAGACALFLKEGNRLIQPPWAASGWAQRGPEVRQYELVGEDEIKENPAPNEKVGLTVWIAVKKQKFTAKSNLELRMHQHHKGTFDPYNFRESEQCESFMGFPLLIKEHSQEHSEDKLVGVLKVETKKKIVDETCFKLTEEALKNLENENIPKNILENLRPIENQEIKDEEEFWDEIKKQIGDEHTVKFSKLILKYTIKKTEEFTYFNELDELVFELIANSAAIAIRTRKRAGSLAKIIKERCREAEINEAELRSGSQRRAVSKLRRRLCFYLSRELGISMAEIARHVGVGTTGVAMAIKVIEAGSKFEFE